MKNLRLIFSFILLVSLFSCDDPLDFDTLEATDFPPGILELRPAGKQLVGDFNVKAVFVDGSVSPLANAQISMVNASGAELFNVSEDLSGTMDSVVVEGSTFDASSLLVGDLFTVNVTVTDSKGQTTTVSQDFEISLLPFAANHNEMYLAGSYNGWGSDAMTLVADNIWEIKEVDLGGEGWKIKNTPDFSDEDWGDPDCTGKLISNQDPSGGNGDTGGSCATGGLINLRFNDQTLVYTTTPAVTFAGNTSGLFLLGTFNNFEGSDYQFTQTADNFWELNDVELEMGAEFKFAESPDFMGKNWGDSGVEGKAEEFGPNFVFGEQTAFYNISFNDKTLDYTVEFVRFPSIGIIGDATPGGWDTDTDLTDNGDGTFSIIIGLSDGEAKFRANDDWAVNWGGTDFPSGVATLDGPNIPVTAGVYSVIFNPSTGEYSFEPGVESLGIIGSATPGGWDADTDLNDNGDGTYSLLIELVDGEAKFRTNDDWGTNWGAGDFPSGVGELDGPNIPVTAGFYNVTFNLATAEYNFAPGVESLGVIGDATPGGWDADTDMRMLDDGTYQIVMFLNTGAVKFRTNDDWATNWGGPGLSGTGVLGGDNIMVEAGLYTLTIDPVTAEYSITPATIGVIGSGTPTGWDSDTDMTLDTATGILSLTIELIDGEAKFRANDDWAWNWGAVDFPTGTGTQNGPNIPVTAGTYTITFNVNTGAYSFQ